jgi:hypothetical protein
MADKNAKSKSTKTGANDAGQASADNGNGDFKRLITPLQAKGTIGKSTVTNLLAEYLQQIGEDWRGFDLDSRNNDFHKTFESLEGKVKKVALYKDEHLDNVGKILSRGLTSNVTLLDPQAFTDQYIREAFQVTKFLDRAPELGVKVTVLIFPFQEDTVMREIVETYKFVNGRADFVIIYNKTKTTDIKNQFQMFFNSPLEKEFLDAGAKRIFIDHLWETVRLKHRQLTSKLDRGIRYAEFAKNEEFNKYGVDWEHRSVMEDWLQHSFWEFDEAAELLTSPSGYEKAKERRANASKPSNLLSETELQEPEKAPSLSDQVNFGDDDDF